MQKKSVFFLSLTFGLILFLLACNLTARGGQTAANVETAVASTVNAMTPLAITATPEAHALPSPTSGPTRVTRVAFVDSARNLYVWTEGTAAPVELVSSGDVQKSFVSSDGSLIAFIRTSDYTSYEMDVINADGSGQRVLISPAAFSALPRPSGSIGLAPYAVHWRPNSHQLGMSLQVLFDGPGLQISNVFYSVNADGGNVAPLFTAGDNFHFAYSPDGNWLVIARPTGDDLYTSAGMLVAANVVTNEFVNTASEYAWAADPIWQADSSNFMLAIPPQDPWANTPGPSAIWRVTNAGVATRVNSAGMSFFPAGIASFDPMLTHMAFTTQVGAAADNNWALHVAGLDGSGDTQIDSGYFAHLPVWSPDGSRSIYAKTAGSINQAYLVQGGSAPTLLSDITSLLDVKWIDSTHYVAASRTGSGVSLLMGTVGSSSGVIFNDPAWNDRQGFSFDINE
jgi:WD40-like Beta Propeller Repeat.